MDECGKTGALGPDDRYRCPEGRLALEVGLSWLPVRVAGYGLKCRYFYESACTLYPVCQRPKHWWACREYDVARVLLNVDWERFGVYEVK